MECRKQGQDQYSPIAAYRGALAKTVWGKTWCDNLEAHSDYDNRLPRGRTYVRNGSVIDLQISAGKVNALVMGSSLHKVAVTVKSRVWSGHGRTACCGVAHQAGGGQENGGQKSCASKSLCQQSGARQACREEACCQKSSGCESHSQKNHSQAGGGQKSCHGSETGKKKMIAKKHGEATTR
jgi:hypothetical protein